MIRAGGALVVLSCVWLLACGAHAPPESGSDDKALATEPPPTSWLWFHDDDLVEVTDRDELLALVTSLETPDHRHHCTATPLSGVVVIFTAR